MVSPWTTPAQIVSKVRRAWDDGRMLRAHLNGEPCTPVVVPLRRPSAADLGAELADAQAWAAALTRAERDGAAYDLETTEVGGRTIGRKPDPEPSGRGPLGAGVGVAGSGRAGRGRRGYWPKPAPRCRTSSPGSSTTRCVPWQPRRVGQRCWPPSAGCARMRVNIATSGRSRPLASTPSLSPPTATSFPRSYRPLESTPRIPGRPALRPVMALPNHGHRSECGSPRVSPASTASARSACVLRRPRDCASASRGCSSSRTKSPI